MWRVLTQSLLIGCLVVYSVRYEQATPAGLPPRPNFPAQSGFMASNSLSMPGTSTHQSSGFDLDLKWVLEIDSDNAWLTKVAAEAEEHPSQIGRYLVSMLTVLLGTFFVVCYSRFFMNNPVERRQDPRPGFEVVGVN